MKRNIVEIFSAVILIVGIIPLCGCSDIEETYLPALYGETDGEPVTHEAQPVQPQDHAAPEISSKTDDRKAEAIQTVNAVPEPKSSSAINGDSHTFAVENVYSDGVYYTVSVVGEKQGDTFGNSRLVLSKDGAETDILDIAIPDGERFLILDSVADGLSYGCTVLSGIRDFAAEEYPDIIQLDFYNEKELEIPQYGRYFAIFDGKLTELSIYENGVKAEPRGTHPELRDAGRMVQHLCVYTPSGQSLMVEKNEYIFDLENRCLNRRKVKFLGWNVDN